MHFGSEKPLKNPFKNKAGTFPKSMLKMWRFSTSIVSGFGLDFGGLRAAKMEPSPPNLGPKTASYIQKITFFRYLGLTWAKKASQEASGDPK